MLLFLFIAGCENEVLLEDADGWVHYPEPIFSGQHPLIGDPSVIPYQDGFLMSYTCFDVYGKPQGGEICLAISKNGTKWDIVENGEKVKGRITFDSEWADAHETSFLLETKDTYYVYAIGYLDEGGFFNSKSKMGLWVSEDGMSYTPYSKKPILEPSPEGYDSDGLTSPSILELDDGYVMLYAGFCLATCQRTPGVYLLTASSSDGIEWEKAPEPLLHNVSWSPVGLGEPELTYSDGTYTIYFTSTENPHAIGIATSNSLSGPWNISEAPILVSTGSAWDKEGVIAPSVLNKDGKTHVWFHGMGKKSIEIGYAHN